MAFLDIHIQTVRNVQKATLQPSKKLNIIVGPNGSGKTTVLESLYLLSRGRSFRTRNIKKVISHSKESLVVFAKLSTKEGISKIAIKKSERKTTVRINEKTQSKASELSRHLYTHLIRPESQTLLENGSAARRGFIDLGVFHVKHQFLNISKKYNQLLKQRNKLLKTRQFDTLNVWDTKLVEYGIMITNERENYVGLMEKELAAILRGFIQDVDIKIEYLKGWDKDSSLAEAMAKAADRDKRYGFSTIGTHKSDIKVMANNKLAKDFLSRGQMKLLVIALYLAQIKLMSKAASKSVCVLLDDIGAELDADNLKKVMLLLEGLDTQVFVTTTNQKRFLAFIKKNETKVFHVKHGEIQEKDIQ